MKKTVVRLLLLVSILAPSASQAQLCRGIPTTAIYALGSRDDLKTMTAELGIRPGIGGLSLNYALPDMPSNGSKGWSYGGRVFTGRSGPNWDVCALTGFQLGYAYLVNAEGDRNNARITNTSIPFALSFGKAIPLARGVRAILFATPQVLLRGHDLVLYNRSDTVSVSEHPIEKGLQAGGGLQVGPLVLRAAVYRALDGTSWPWTLSAGVSR